MKKLLKILFLCLVLILAIVIIFNIQKVAEERKIFVQKKLDEAYEYFLNKYGNDVELQTLDYSVMDGFRVNYRLVDNPDIKFSIVYWESEEQYSDNYLQALLTDELEKIIISNLSDAGIDNLKLNISTMMGPPYDLSNRLYEYYQMLGRYPRIKDIISLECFPYITLYHDKDLSNDEKNYIRKIIKECNLPIEDIYFQSTKTQE